MATMTCTHVVQIGEAAGTIWHTLDENGPLSLAKLVKTMDVPRDLIMQGIGWLAREDKLDIVETSRGRIFSLR